MDSIFPFCDFCGCPEALIACPTDEAGFCWYACPECALLIEKDEWGRLEERCLEAYTATRGLLGEDRRVAAEQAARLVDAFRASRLVPA